MNGKILLGGMMGAVLLAAGAVELPLSNPEAPFVRSGTKPAPGRSKPVFDAAGKRIVFGSKVFQVYSSGLIRLMDSGRETASFYVYSNTPYAPWLSNQKVDGTRKLPYLYGAELGTESITADAATKTITIKGKTPYHKKTDPEIVGDYLITLRLLDSGKAALHFEFKVPDKAEKGFMAMFCTVNRAKGFFNGKKKMEFPEKKWGSIRKPETIRVFTDNEAETFEMNFPQGNGFYITPKGGFHINKITDKADPKRFVTDVEIDLLKWSGEAQTGAADLKKLENMDPENTVCRNMVHNPYLARGLNFIGGRYRKTWVPLANVSLSDRDPKIGERCLRIKAEPFSYIDLATVSVAPGDYTVSLYARSEHKASFWLVLGGHNWGAPNYTKKLFNNIPSKWKRYELTVHVPTVSALRFTVGVKSNQPDSAVYFDGFQLEKGKNATEFTADPVSAQLLTSAPDDFIRSGSPINARLRLSTLKNKVSGKVKITVLDMFDTVLAEKQSSFRFGAKEHPEIPLELEGKIPDGVHRVRAEFEADGKKYTEYSRFSVMPFFRNEHKLKNMFSLEYTGKRVYMDAYPGLETYLRRCMHLGVGSTAHFAYPMPELDALCRKYNYEILDAGFCGRARTETKRLQKLFPGCKPEPGHIYFFFSFTPTFEEFQDHFKGGLLLDYRLCGGWSEEYRKKVVETAAHIVRQASARPYYFFGSELPAEIKDDPHYVDLVAAVREGVKKVYPNSRFGEGGPPNMYAGSGIREIDQFLTRAKGKMPIEAINCHTYTHNVALLEKDLKVLFDVVENKHGLKDTKIFFGEGMHFGPYHVPEWGMDSVNWDHRGWGSGSVLSYDMGWSEKRNAAWFMRCWLTFMTRMDKVVTANASMSCRSGNFEMDCQLRPRLFQKVPNTLTALLGDAKRFVKDVSFAQDTKCLIWEDGQGRPVAAVWNQEQAVDNGMKQSPWATAALPEGTEIFDMMGNKRSWETYGRFPVSPFPFFLRAPASRMDALIKALTYAELEGVKQIPFKSDMMLVSRQKVDLTLSNVKSRPVTAGITVNGKKREMTFAPLGEKTMRASLADAVPYDRIVPVTVPYEITSGGLTEKASGGFNALAVKYFTGGWKKIPSIPLVNARKGKKLAAANFSAKMQLAWDKKNLYLRVAVKDDKFVHEEYAISRQRYDNDSLQIFIDTRCSARKSKDNQFDEDDYAYTVVPSADGKSARMFRWRSPDMQLTLGTAAPKDMTFADDIPCKFTRIPGGYIYETAIPAKYLLPARLEENYCMGFAVFVNDRDNGKHAENNLTSTPEGTSPYNRPKFYPQILLTNEK